MLACLCVSIWIRTAINLIKGPEKCSEAREDFHQKTISNGLTQEGQRQFFVSIYLFCNSAIEFMAETIDYKSVLIRSLSGMSVILVISTAMNAMGDSIFIWSVVLSAFIITPLMINRQLKKEKENKLTEHKNRETM